MRIAEVVPMEDNLLFIEAEDGVTGLFDVKPYLSSEVFAPLQDHTEFMAVHNGVYFLEWACGADLSADTIEARWRPTPLDIGQHMAR
ncbi:MAG: DUF2442 domain-containing protein [Chromatiaceae bacterium]|nr:DUF2442 domain-containing protein [Chromatiaceae bacterium]